MATVTVRDTYKGVGLKWLENKHDLFSQEDKDACDAKRDEGIAPTCGGDFPYKGQFGGFHGPMDKVIAADEAMGYGGREEED